MTNMSGCSVLFHIESLHNYLVHVTNLLVHMSWIRVHVNFSVFILSVFHEKTQNSNNIGIPLSTHALQNKVKCLLIFCFQCSTII